MCVFVVGAAVDTVSPECDDNSDNNTILSQHSLSGCVHRIMNKLRVHQRGCSRWWCEAQNENPELEYPLLLYSAPISTIPTDTVALSDSWSDTPSKGPSPCIFARAKIVRKFQYPFVAPICPQTDSIWSGCVFRTQRHLGGDSKHQRGQSCVGHGYHCNVV